MYTQYTIFIMNMKIMPDYSKSAAMRFFSWGLKNEFETAVVKEPSVLDPLKFYCTLKRSNLFLFFIAYSERKGFAPLQAFSFPILKELFHPRKHIESHKPCPPLVEMAGKTGGVVIH